MSFIVVPFWLFLGAGLPHKQQISSHSELSIKTTLFSATARAHHQRTQSHTTLVHPQPFQQHQIRSPTALH